MNDQNIVNVKVLHSGAKRISSLDINNQKVKTSKRVKKNNPIICTMHAWTGTIFLAEEIAPLEDGQVCITCFRLVILLTISVETRKTKKRSAQSEFESKRNRISRIKHRKGGHKSFDSDRTPKRPRKEDRARYESEERPKGQINLITI